MQLKEFGILRLERSRKYVRPFVDDIANYGTHSIKSGAASNPGVFLAIFWTCMPAGSVPLLKAVLLSILLVIA